MNLPDLAEHRIRLLLKKSVGKATESDLKDLESLEESMRKAEPSATSEEDKKLLEWSEKSITVIESNLINCTIDDPRNLDFSKS